MNPGTQLWRGKTLRSNTSKADDTSGPHEDSDFDRKQAERHDANGAARLDFEGLNPSEGEVRLLEFSPDAPGGSSERMECRLTKHSIHGHVHYDALSHAWGHPVLAQAIILNGKPFWVTQTLFEALTTLRQKLNPRGRACYIWIDALCINQDDTVERGHQVSLMRTLYMRAQVMHVWLGLYSQRLEMLFAKWNMLLREDEAAGLTSETFDLDPYDGGDLPQSAVSMLDRDDGSYEGLKELINRPWWSRVWVQQEVLLSREPVFHIGEATYSNNAIMGLLWRLSMWMLHQRDPAETDSEEMKSEGIVDKVILIATRYRTHILREGFSPGALTVNMLDSINDSCEASDPRDRIYGLLGLLPPAIGERIVPDYTASTERVYEDASYEIMQQIRSLDMLLLHAHSNQETTHGPSWMPRLTRYHPGCETLDPSEGSSFYIARSHPGVLTVKSFIADAVCAATTSSEKILQDVIHQLEYQDRLRYVANHWETFSNTVCAQASLPIPDSYTFWRTVIQDPDTLAEERTSNLAVHNEATTAAIFETWLQNSSEIQDFRSKTWGRLGILRNPNSRFFVTKKGRLGTLFVEESAKICEGDVVAVVAACSRPLVLRAVDGTNGAFTVVAPCYCDGIMEGEAIRAAALAKTGTEEDVDSVFELVDLH